jgi:hypothetical protein
VCVCTRGLLHCTVELWTCMWDHHFGKLQNVQQMETRQPPSDDITNYQVTKCPNSVIGPVLLFSLDLKFVKISNKNTEIARTSNMPFRDLHSSSYQLRSITMDTREMTSFIFYVSCKGDIHSSTALTFIFYTHMSLRR